MYPYGPYNMHSYYPTAGSPYSNNYNNYLEHLAHLYAFDSKKIKELASEVGVCLLTTCILPKIFQFTELMKG